MKLQVGVAKVDFFSPKLAGFEGSETNRMGSFLGNLLCCSLIRCLGSRLVLSLFCLTCWQKMLLTTSFWHEKCAQTVLIQCLSERVTFLDAVPHTLGLPEEWISLQGSFSSASCQDLGINDTRSSIHHSCLGVCCAGNVVGVHAFSWAQALQCIV